MRKRTIHKAAAALTALTLCAGVLTGCGGHRCFQRGKLCRRIQRSFQ